MSKAHDEQQTRLERARRIGLFRYMLIREAADASLTPRQRGALVRKLAAVAHTDPDGRSIRITRWTLDRWIQTYREGGFDALVPSPRQSQPRTPPEVFELAAALKKENPSRSAALVRRILHAQLGWAPDETTLQRMFVRTGLTALRAPAEPAVFGRFEAARPNEIWTGDALHGPRIEGRKTYLFAFLDDNCAPRGAPLYPRSSREKLEGRFLGPMAYLDPKGEGDNSMPGKQQSRSGVEARC
jgi:putative transposase